MIVIFVVDIEWHAITKREKYPISTLKILIKDKEVNAYHIFI